MAASSDGAAAPDFLVQLGQLPAYGRRAARIALGKHAQRRRQPLRRLERHQRLAARPTNIRSSSARLRGKKPTKRQRSAGRPEATIAVTTLLAPGSTSTGSPASMHARTSL